MELQATADSYTELNVSYRSTEKHPRPSHQQIEIYAHGWRLCYSKESCVTVLCVNIEYTELQCNYSKCLHDQLCTSA